jgi:hypothetical protein
MIAFSRPVRSAIAFLVGYAADVLFVFSEGVLEAFYEGRRDFTDGECHL